jgi:pyruvate dehydrogenase E1 component alpha subunit
MSEMAAGYRMSAAMADGNDMVVATEAALTAAEYVRSGQGPYFLEFHTWRWQGIFSGDLRAPEEVRLWKEDRDPIRRARGLILAKGIAREDDLAAIQSEVETLVADWVRYALESPPPDPGTALDYVYATPEVFSR